MIAVDVKGARHCGLKNCHEYDFLPFQCDACEGTYCLRHYPYAEHSCPQAENFDCRAIVCPLCKVGVRLEPGADVAMVYAAHERVCTKKAQKKKVCPTPGCKEKLGIANSFTCDLCGQDVCIKHRYEGDHPCKKLDSAATVATKSLGKQAAATSQKGKPCFLACFGCGRTSSVRD